MKRPRSIPLIVPGRRPIGIGVLAVALAVLTAVVVACTDDFLSPDGSAPPVPVFSVQEEGTPDFTKVFSPDPIGPGSASMLTFTIDNSGEGTPVSAMAFTDVLPAGVTLASPAFVSNTCGGTLTAPNGGTTVSLTGGMLGAGAKCTIVVNVTGSTAGVHMNVSGDLISSAGNSGTAAADLEVTIDLPGFIKSFSPAAVEFGGRSTLTFIIDNTANPAVVPNLDFTDVLPANMVVASPANKATTCGTTTIPPTLTAIPGSSTITLDADGTVGFPAVGAMSLCTVTVDVVGNAVGLLGNVTELLAEFVSAGKAAAVLEVTPFVDLLTLEKEFTDDPTAPGGTATLEFTVTNRSRDDAATGITFTDDLEATLTGLTPTLPPTPDPPCGAGSMLSFSMGDLTLTGGNLAAEASCTFTVSLTVPGGAVPGTYPNSAGPVSGDVGGSPETGNTATDKLFVVGFPILTKEFTDDPVGTGGTVTLEFTITNSLTTSALSDIEFLDELTSGGSGGSDASIGVSPSSGGFLPFPVSVGLPPSPDPPCGPSSSLALVSAGTDRQALELTGGSLAPAGFPGDSCTFTVTVDIPEDLPAGTYNNSTEEIFAALADFGGTPTVEGPGARDSIVVVAAPQLAKEFTNDPVLPGGTVTLEFTFQNLDPDNAASAIAFTDDLGDALAGLTLTSVDANTCGGTVSGVGTDMFGYSGGTLAAEAECTITLTLTVPGGVAGTFNNETSVVTATVLGETASAPKASDDLIVTPLTFTKEFTNDPAALGGTVTLLFTLALDASASGAVTGIFFTDNLAAVVPGTPDLMVASLDVNTCGGSESGTPTFIIYTGGSLSPGTSCTISFTLDVPALAESGTFNNVTSSLGSSLGTQPPAVDAVTVAEPPSLGLTKEFIDDPTPAGGVVTLQFTIGFDGLSPATGIGFTDDLDAALTDLVALGLPKSNVCGTGSELSGTSVLTLTGGSLSPGGSCTFTASLLVPVDAPPGLHINTTSSITGMSNAMPVTGDPASDGLEVLAGLLGMDFGDAPNGAYETLLAFDGARHILGSSLFLGATVDDERDGQPNGGPNGATGDDLNGAIPDDEDGVTFTSLINPGGIAKVDVVASVAGGFLSAWGDFNFNGSWTDPGEQFFTDVALSAGTNSLTFTVPAAATVGGRYVRFRLSTATGLLPTGEAPDGEVEDYRINVTEDFDFGDAPGVYPTRLAQNGARHKLGSGIFLGASVDEELDGQPTGQPNGAAGDDQMGSTPDDEDGVKFTSALVPGMMATVDVVASAPGILNAWIDFNFSGVWQASERIFANVPLSAGTNSLSFLVPAGTALGNKFARFRINSTGGLAPNGMAADGEVEDYQVTVGRLDFGDAPGVYPTKVASNGAPGGARHILSSGLFLGAAVDSELDGQPNGGPNGATGDDLKGATPDDEDGVMFVGALTPGSMATVEVIASQAGVLNAWIDWELGSGMPGAGVWGPTDQIFTNVPLVAGLNTLMFTVPASAVPAAKYARFRVNAAGGLGPTGLAVDGEVEDYRVEVVP